MRYPDPDNAGVPKPLSLQSPGPEVAHAPIDKIRNRVRWAAKHGAKDFYRPDDREICVSTPQWMRTDPTENDQGSPMKLFGRVISIQLLVIFALAGLLIFYHAYTLYDLYFGTGTDLYEVGGSDTHSGFEIVQSVLRVAIILSLLLVIQGKQLGLYGMWFSISSLIATHYWAHFSDLPFHFLEGRHPLSYLKGLIIPTVVTLLRRSIDSPKRSEREARSSV